jgi:ABC-type nitrate/sulfonate/bicarbonate transport system substrate-binding protein
MTLTAASFIRRARCLHPGAAPLRALLVLAMGLALVLLAPARHASAQAGALRPVLNIAVSRTNLSLPLYVADAKGLFKAEGLDVRIAPCLGGLRCMDQVLEGKADLGTSTEIVGALQSFNRTDFALVASFVSSGNDVKLLTRKSSGIRSWADLAGRRLAVVKGTSAHYYLDASLLFNGTATKDIELLMLPPEQVGPALLAGKADALAIWEPFAYETRRALGADALLLPGERIYTTTFNLYGLRNTLQLRQADVVRVLRALGKAERFIAERPKEAQDILRSALKVDQAFIDAVWAHYDYRLQLSQSLVSTMDAQARWAVRSGHVSPGAVPANMLDIIDVEPLRRADPAAVTLAK